jgi:hypothetical protein
LGGKYSMPLARTTNALAEFAPRFLGWAKAERQKASGIDTKRNILKTHLLPALATTALDAISEEKEGEAESIARETPQEDPQQRLDRPLQALEGTFAGNACSAKTTALRAWVTCSATGSRLRRDERASKSWARFTSSVTRSAHTSR